MGAVDNVFSFHSCWSVFAFKFNFIAHYKHFCVCEVSLLVTFCVILGDLTHFLRWYERIKKKKNQLLWFLSKLQLVVRCWYFEVQQTDVTRLCTVQERTSSSNNRWSMLQFLLCRDVWSEPLSSRTALDKNRQPLKHLSLNLKVCQWCFLIITSCLNFESNHVVHQVVC